MRTFRRRDVEDGQRDVSWYLDEKGAPLDVEGQAEEIRETLRETLQVNPHDGCIVDWEAGLRTLKSPARRVLLTERCLCLQRYNDPQVRQ